MQKASESAPVSEPTEHEVTSSDRIAHTPQSASVRQFLGELLRNIALVTAIVWVARTLIFQPFVVEGTSMAPNLATNDYLIVDKLTYLFSTPTRGQIVVFKYPNNPAISFVKRIIGLPGDTVKIADNSVTIINKTHPEGIRLNENYLTNGMKTTLQTGAANGEFVVPADKYFVMGDNREASSDSRMWGFLPKEDLTGRAVLRLFPFDKVEVISHASYTDI